MHFVEKVERYIGRREIDMDHWSIPAELSFDFRHYFEIVEDPYPNKNKLLFQRY